MRETQDLAAFPERITFLVKREKDNALNDARNPRRLSNEEIARSIGKSRQSLSAYMDGSQGPDFQGLITIAKRFNVSVDFLIGNSGIDAPDIGVQKICEYTGLSTCAVQKLHGVVASIEKIMNDEHKERDAHNHNPAEVILSAEGMLFFLNALISSECFRQLALNALFISDTTEQPYSCTVDGASFPEAEEAISARKAMRDTMRKVKEYDNTTLMKTLYSIMEERQDVNRLPNTIKYDNEHSHGECMSAFRDPYTSFIGEAYPDHERRYKSESPASDDPDASALIDNH